ncbi:MAG: L,D-transpeptidase family protein [Chitinophagales bacterium]
MLTALHFSACKYIKESSFGKSLISTPEYEQAAFQDSLIRVSLADSSLYALLQEGKFSDTLPKILAQAYPAPETKLWWVDVSQQKVSPIALQMMEVLENAELQGLISQWYAPDKLRLLSQKLDVDTTNKVTKSAERLAQLSKFDISLTAAAFKYWTDLSAGRLEISRWDIPQKAPDLLKCLQTLAQTQKVSTASDIVLPTHPGYAKMLSQLQKYREAKANGTFAKINASTGNAENLQNLEKILFFTGDLSQRSNAEKLSWNDDFKNAITHFQERHGLETTATLDGKTLAWLNKTPEEMINLLLLNLERYRWLPDSMGQKYVFVNAPEFWMSVFENYHKVLDMNVVVGDQVTQTPMFYANMEYLVFSPVWNVPQSIARDEILAWVDKNPALLVLADVEAFYKGKKVDVWTVDWKAAKTDWRNWTFKQKPTEKNSLGDVKFIFPNKHSVYLHDTPDKKYFKLHFRALSSGCVRVSKPVEFAHYLLQDVGGWDDARIQSAMKRSSEMRVNLAKQLPVYIYYLTAWANEAGEFEFRDDIYGHDRRQLKALEEAWHK